MGSSSEIAAIVRPVNSYWPSPSRLILKTGKEEEKSRTPLASNRLTRLPCAARVYAEGGPYELHLRVKLNPRSGGSKREYASHN